MQVEHKDNEIIIRLSAGTDLVGLQQLLDYVCFQEIASKSNATQEEIDQLSKESKSSWWKKNKKHFLGEDSR